MNWGDHLAEMAKTFPGYVDDFLALEALAPPEDLPRLKLLTEHEVAAIAFIERELASAAESDRPLKRYLGQL